MTVSIYVFPALLKEFQRLHPDVDVKVMTGSGRTAACAGCARARPISVCSRCP